MYGSGMDTDPQIVVPNAHSKAIEIKSPLSHKDADSNRNGDDKAAIADNSYNSSEKGVANKGQAQSQEDAKRPVKKLSAASPAFQPGSRIIQLSKSSSKDKPLFAMPKSQPGSPRSLEQKMTSLSFNYGSDAQGAINPFVEPPARADPFSMPQLPYSPKMLNLDPRPADSMVAKNPYVPPPIKAKLPTYQRHIMSFSADFEIRNENSKKAMAMISIQEPDLPNKLDTFHSVSTLRSNHIISLPSGTYSAAVYKAVSIVDGKTYCLYRIKDYMDIGKDNLAMINVWRAVRHPNLISVQKAFTTRAFYDQSMVVVYDFYPLAVSVSTMFSEKTSSLYGSFVERDDFLWLVVVPIVLALRRIHSSNLAYRCLNAQNVLISGKSKILLSNVGIFDIDGPNVAETHRLQIQDIVDLGKLILLLKGVNNMENAIEGREALEMIKSGSDDLYIWGVALLNSNGQGLTINHIVSLMASHIADYSENLQTYSDHVMTELGKELENGRFIRLMCKLNFILERPELENDTKWAETGDCYLIKLFRDYVFHQVNENGAPIIDVAHVFTNLNKLDAGCSERIMLTSRDENSCLIVSYQDLKRCVESAYVDLINASRRSK